MNIASGLLRRMRHVYCEDRHSRPEALPAGGQAPTFIRQVRCRQSIQWQRIVMQDSHSRIDLPFVAPGAALARNPKRTAC